MCCGWFQGILWGRRHLWPPAAERHPYKEGLSLSLHLSWERGWASTSRARPTSDIPVSSKSSWPGHPQSTQKRVTRKGREPCLGGQKPQVSVPAQAPPVLTLSRSFTFCLQNSEGTNKL